MPGTVLCTSHGLIDQTLRISLRGGDCYYPYFTDEEAENTGSGLPCAPASHNSKDASHSHLVYANGAPWRYIGHKLYSQSAERLINLPKFAKLRTKEM